MTETPKNTTESQTTTSNTVSRSGGPGGQGDRPPERLAIPIVGIDTHIGLVDESIKPPYNEALTWETAAMFRLFLAYRNLGAARTYTAVAEKCGTAPGYVSKIAGPNLWQRRVIAYQEHLALIEMQEQEEQIKKLVKDQKKAGNLLFTKGFEVAQSLDKDLITPKDAKDWIIAGLKQRGLAAGVDITKDGITVNIDNRSLTINVGSEEVEMDVPEAKMYMESLILFLKQKQLFSEFLSNQPTKTIEI